MNALLKMIGSGVNGQLNPFGFEDGNPGDMFGGPQGAGYMSGDALRAKMAGREPTLSTAAQQGPMDYFNHNPGQAAMGYALFMNQGIPDAVAVTASNMPWMTHYRDPRQTNEQYQRMPQMEHPALGAPPWAYKFYNQIGGNTAYDGGGMPAVPGRAKTVDSATREAWAEKGRDDLSSVHRENAERVASAKQKELLGEGRPGDHLSVPQRDPLSYTFDSRHTETQRQINNILLRGTDPYGRKVDSTLVQRS